MSVFPVPGGPKRRIPVTFQPHQHPGERRKGGERKRTLDVLNAELFDEPRREDTTGESATENGRELGVQASDAHVLELEVGSEDGVWWSPARRGSVSLSGEARGGVKGEGEREEYTLLGARFDLDSASRILDKVDLTLRRQDAHPPSSSTASSL